MKASPPSSSSWMVEVGKLLKTFFKKIYIFSWLHWVVIAVHGLFLVAVASLIVEHRL